MSDYKDPRPDSTASAADPCVIYDNAVSMSKVVNGTTTVTTYTGKELRTVSQIIDGLNWNPAGKFADGVTFNSLNDFALDGDNTQWIYVGSDTFPVTVTAGFDPSGDADYQVIHVGDHNMTTNRNPADGSAHNADDIGRGTSTVDADITAIESNILTINNDIVTINTNYLKASWVANKLVDANTVGHPTFGETFNIGCFGDSTMWGSFPSNTTVQEPNSSPVSLGIALALMFPNSTPTVVNKAVPATTLKQMLAGNDAQFDGTYEERIQADPNMLLIYCNHCLNDCNSYQSNAQEYHDDLVEFVIITRRNGRIPVIVTPTMITPVVDGQEFMMRRMPAFIQAQRDVAKSMNVDLVDNFYYSYKSSRFYKPKDIAPDGVHLSTIFYQMAGRNMAIPLLKPQLISKNKDIKGLSTSLYSDTITNGRGIFDGGRFTAILSGDSTASDQNIYFPVLLDDPTDDNILVMGGYKTGAGSKSKFTYFGSTASPYFAGDIDYSADLTSLDGLFAANIQAIPAGLAILGVKNNTSYGGNGPNFTMAGFQRLSRNQVSFGYPVSSGFQNSQPIFDGIEVATSFAINPAIDATIISLSAFEDSSERVSVKVQSGNVVVITNGVSQTIWTGAGAGTQFIKVFINYNRTVFYTVGGLTLSSAIQSAALPKMYVSTGSQYRMSKA